MGKLNWISILGHQFTLVLCQMSNYFMKENDGLKATGHGRHSVYNLHVHCQNISFFYCHSCLGDINMGSWLWNNYRISANSFRGNYSFLNLTLCSVTFGHSTYRCGNYSRKESIQGRKLFAEIRYLNVCWSLIKTLTTRLNPRM